MSIPGSANPLLLASAAATAGYQIERSLRFNSADSAYLSRTPASAGNRKTWTWAGWVKRSGFGGNKPIFGTNFLGASYCSLYFDGNNTFFLENYSGGYQARLQTTQVFRDPSAWLHIVVALDTTQATPANRARIYVNGSEVTAFTIATYPSQNTDLLINNNQYHEISTSSSTYAFNGYLADIHFIDGQALTPSSFGEFDTNNVWQPKAYTGSYGTNGFQLKFADNSAATAAALGKDTSGNGNNWTPNNFSVVTYTNPIFSNYLTAVSGGGFRTANPATYAFDNTTNTRAITNTVPNSIRLTPPTSITGVNSLDVFIYVDRQNTSDTYFFKVNGSTVSSNISTYPASGGNFGYVNLTIPANTTLTSVEFGHLSSGVSVQLGAVRINGNILIDSFSDTTDSLVDSPTNYGTDTGAGGEVRGNYATLNPLCSDSILIDGNIRASNASNTHLRAYSTIPMSSGKYYFEFVIESGLTADRAVVVGIANATALLKGSFVGTDQNSWGYLTVLGASVGEKINNNTRVSYGAAWTNGDVIGVAVNLDTGTLTFYKNGVSQGTAYSGLSLSNSYVPAFSISAFTGTITANINFGQRPFAYTAPSGFKALCTANLPAPVIAKPNTVMDVKLYTGNGGTQTISGLNFSPDLVWIKNRIDSSAGDHRLYDTVRGATKELYSNLTVAEGTEVNGLTAFSSDGFSVGSINAINGSSDAIVAWTWDAGTSTVTNTQGSITSQVRANASAGFSIVTYTGNGTSGATVGHGLNVAPSFYVCKFRNTNAANGPWYIYHKSLGATKTLTLNTTDAASTLSSTWNNAEPSSTVFSLGNAGDTNGSGRNFIAYCFAPVFGFSAFGSYTGNGSTDGPFVYTGFRPRWVMVKASSASGYDWYIYDAARDTFNAANKFLSANLSGQEQVTTDGTVTDLFIDALSNGFKIRSSRDRVNISSGTFIYACFAESPFATARAR